MFTAAAINVKKNVKEPLKAMERTLAESNDCIVSMFLIVS